MDSTKNNWFPLKSEKDARAFWGSSTSMSFLPQLKLFATNDRQTVSTDVAVSFIGPTRNAFGFSLTAAEQNEDEGDEEADERTNLEKVFAAGGDAYLTIAYPLFCLPKCPLHDCDHG